MEAMDMEHVVVQSKPMKKVGDSTKNTKDIHAQEEKTIKMDKTKEARKEVRSMDVEVLLMITMQLNAQRVMKAATKVWRRQREGGINPGYPPCYPCVTRTLPHCYPHVTTPHDTLILPSHSPMLTHVTRMLTGAL